MNPSYIATNQEELFDKTSPQIQQLILGDEVSTATSILGKKYNLPLGSYVALSNIISFILIGALEPKNVLLALREILMMSAEDAYSLAGDLEKSILEKARILILKKPAGEMITLTFEKAVSVDQLRKEILDTTKRESALVKDQSTLSSNQTPSREPTILATGSRSQLLEQLQILDSIPNDDEINSRLDYIKEQIQSLDKKEKERVEASVTLQQSFISEEKGSSPVEAASKAAPYSKAPTKYNVDPYRELPGDE